MDINKIKRYYRKNGLFHLLKRAMGRIGSFLFSYIPLNFYCVSSVPSISIQPKCPLNIRKGDIADLGLIANFSSDENSQKNYDQTKYFLDKGGEVFLAFSGDKLVHIARLHYSQGLIDSSSLEINPPVRIKEDEVYIGFCQTSPEFKGKNIYPAVLQYIIKYAFEKNKKKCFISTSPSLVPSVRGIEKAGFALVSKKHKFRILGKIFNNCWSSSSVSVR